MIYVYKCKEHGEFEIKCSMNDVQVTEKCPECGEESNRSHTSPIISFKGYGWTQKMHRQR